MDHSYGKSGPQEEKKRQSTTYCCVPLCSNYGSPDLSTHTFPKNETLRKKWETVLRMGRPASNFMRVCGKHFTSSDYFPSSNATKKRKLYPHAVPSQKLPQRSHDPVLTSPQKRQRESRRNRALTRHVVYQSSARLSLYLLSDAVTCDRMIAVPRIYDDAGSEEMQVKEEPQSDTEEVNREDLEISGLPSVSPGNEMDSDEDELKPPAAVLVKQEIIEEESIVETRVAPHIWQEGGDSLAENSLSPALLEPEVTIDDGEVASTSAQLSDLLAQERREVSEKIKSGEYILLKKERSRSKVWERFSSVYDAVKQRYVGYVQCSTCGCLLSMKLGTGTTHLSRHLCTVVEKARAVSVSRRKKSEIVNSCLEKCVEMCVRDQRPCNIVSGEGFQMLGQELIKIGAVYGNVDVKYILPPASSISEQVSSIAHNIRQTVLPDVHKAIRDGVCAMELYTERLRNTHLVAVTSQYITDDWKIQRQLLFTSQCLNEQDPGIPIQEEIQMKLAGLGIFSEDVKKLTFVTGHPLQTNHSSILVNHMQCAAYSLCSVVRNTLDEETFVKIVCPDVLKCLQVGKNVIRHLKMSGLNKMLEDMSKNCSLPHWNLVVVVLETVHRNYEFLVKHFTERNEMSFINGWNNKLVGELVLFFSKFKEVISELTKNTFPTLHLVLVYFHELYDHCLPCSSDHAEITLIKRRAKNFLKEIQFAKKHYIATFLCPNTRLLKRLDADTRRTVHEEVQNMCSEVNAQLASVSLQSPPLKRSRFGAWSQHEEDQGPSFDEIALYLATGRQESEEPCDFLSWWEGKAKAFPRLSQVARKVLCIPATCSSYEHMCRLSSAEDCNLISDQVTDLLLVHDRPEAGQAIMGKCAIEEMSTQLLV